MSGRFKPEPDLEQKIARMIVPEVQEMVDRAEGELKQNAPKTKTWVTARDAHVRTAHAMMDGVTVAENERFKVPAYQWDVEHPGAIAPRGRGHGRKPYKDAPLAPGYFAFMDEPGDPTSGAYVNTVNCFPGDTLVSATQVRGATRRWYRGPVVRVETEQGHVLTGTPNHPVLTDRGWVALGELDVSDKLVCQDRGRAAPSASGEVVDPHVDDLPARIDEVARALTVAGDHQRIPDMPVYFHGDGLEGEVDVVRAESLLECGVMPALGQEARQFELPDAESLVEVLLPSLRAQDAARPRIRHLALRGMRRLSESLSTLGAFALHANPVRVGAVARVMARLPDPATDRGPRHAVLDAESLERFSGQELLHDFGVGDGDSLGRIPPPGLASRHAESLEVIQHGGCADSGRGGDVSDGDDVLVHGDDLLIGDEPGLAGNGLLLSRVARLGASRLEGYVYNLDTIPGWYVANGIVAHNCRCTVKYNDDGVAAMVRATQARAEGETVRAEVIAEGKGIIEAEYGDEYPGGHVAQPTSFIRRTLNAIRNRIRGRGRQ